MKKLGREFEALGLAVSSAWKAAGYHRLAFPRAAESALRDFVRSREWDASELLTWVSLGAALPPQAHLSSRFGEPPVTVYWHPRFHVDVLFWGSGTTVIHQHAFSGAFAVLSGASFHVSYTFESERDARAVQFGELAVASCEFLRCSMVRPIAAGQAFIHAAFHLDMPTVTVVVRTHGEPEAGPQYDYMRPGLAVDPDGLDQNELRAVQALELMRRAESQEWVEIAVEAIEQAPLGAVVRILQGAFLAKNKDDRSRIWEAGARRLGTHISVVKAAVEERARVTAVINLRGRVYDTEVRTLLALAANVGERESVLHAVEALWPIGESQQRLLAAIWKLRDNGAAHMDVAQLDAAERLITRGSQDGYWSSSQVEHDRRAIASHPVLAVFA